MARNDQGKKEQPSKEAPKKVLMRFEENKFYNDMDNPEFEAGKVYTLEGENWINRWLKRGGIIMTEDEAKKFAADKAGKGKSVSPPPVGDKHPPVTPPEDKTKTPPTGGEGDKGQNAGDKGSVPPAGNATPNQTK